MHSPEDHLPRNLIKIISCLVLIMISTGSARDSRISAQGVDALLVHGADVVLLNGKIWTGELSSKRKLGEKEVSRVEAVAISNTRFLAVGTNREIKAYIGKNTNFIDMQGRMGLPGFIDGHVHFMSGSFQLLTVDLKDARSEVEFVKRLAAKAKDLPAGRWIQGGEWDEEAWPDASLPTR